MSMAGFFKAYRMSDIKTMQTNTQSITDFAFNEDAAVFETDVDMYWHVLEVALDGVGMHVGDYISDAPLDACFIAEADAVKIHSLEMFKWTQERLENAVENIEEEDVYALDEAQDNPEQVARTFKKLHDFLIRAAADDLGVLHYVA